MAAKKFHVDLDVDGKVIVTAVEAQTGGAADEVFFTNGGKGKPNPVSTDSGNSIVQGSDGRAFYQLDETFTSLVFEAASFKNCKYLHQIANDYSDLDARASAFNSNEFFVYSRSGTYGVAVRDTEDYDMVGMQVAFELTTSAFATSRLNRGVYWLQPFKNSDRDTVSLAGWKLFERTGFETRMGDVSTDLYAFVYVKPATAGSGGGSTPTIVSADANNSITEGGDGGAYLDLSAFGGEDNNVEFYAAVANFPATGVVDTLYVAKAELTLHIWNGSSYDEVSADTNTQDNDVEVYPDEANLPVTGALGIIYVAEAENTLHRWDGAAYQKVGDGVGSGGGGNTTQQVLTDAASVSWNFGTNPIALLTATGAVGNTRALANSLITSGEDGNTYQLTFVQDGTGGRSINFDTNYNVVGQFDLAANRRTIITIVVQGTEADVILTPVIDPEKPESLTGTDIDMSKYFGNVYNYATPSSALAYTTTNPIVNGFARCYVNAASEPVVYETDGSTPATKAGGVSFAPNVLMEMIVDSPDGVNIEYYFINR